MGFFDDPTKMILALAVLFLLFMAIAVLLVMKAMKVTNGPIENDFQPLSRIQHDFEKTGRIRLNRILLYITITGENLQDMQVSSAVISDIKGILLETFSDGKYGMVSLYGDKTFLAFVKWDLEEMDKTLVDFQEEINRCLVQHRLLNIVNVRVGSYLAAGSYVTFEESMDRAKQACIMATNEKTSHVRWNSVSGKNLKQRIKIENEIENEIDNNRFFLEYQPLLDAKTKEIMGAEVLARLNSSSDGVLSPGRFLSAVDSVGINNKFDHYIFEKNCKWIANNKEQRDHYLYSINFFRATLCDPNFPFKIMEIVEQYGLEYSSLAVEILEDRNITSEERKQMHANLVLLKEKGVSIMLDDFGTGYSTFGDLTSIDIDIVKIDREITQNAVTENGYVILSNIIRTAQSIGCKTLCEGIETKEQEEIVIKAGCDYLQGFYYYKPMPVVSLENLFMKGTGGIGCYL